MKGDFGTIAAGTWTTGTYQQPNVWRGCENEPGDLDNRKRNADGTLNVTGMPTITLSAAIQTYGIVNTVIQNINYTANVNAYMTTNAADDGVRFVNCKFENTNTGTSARIFNVDNSWMFINCDLIANASTAVSTTIGTADSTLHLVQCRIEAKNAASATMVISNVGARIEGCVFVGNGTNTAYFQDTDGTGAFSCNNNTFYNLGTCWASTIATTGGRNSFYNNLMVNCVNSVNLSDASNAMLFYFNNRTRNVTNPPNVGGTEDIIEMKTNAVDDDYFVDAPNGNFNLLPTSPAVNAALDYSNVGALDLIPSGGSGVYNPFQQQRIR
jgi:hypothetical protein